MTRFEASRGALAIALVTMMAGGVLAQSTDRPDPGRASAPEASPAAFPGAVSDGKFQLPVALEAKAAGRLRAVLQPIDAEGTGDPVALGGVCPGESITYADSNFEGTFIGTIPPGMVETEIAAASYTLPPGDFPILLDLAEIIFAQTHFNPTVTQWTFMVWEGTPQTGTLIESYSSDGLILPHVELPVGGAQAVNLQVSVDPGDPDQIIINDNGTQTFSIGWRIDGHNDPPTSSCGGVCCLPAVCCPPTASTNAWPAMDQAGPGPFGSKQWLFARDCPGGCFPGLCFISGWLNFSDPELADFVNDWAIRVTYSPLTCDPGAGACCFDDGSCSVEANEAECTIAGGVFAGMGLDCQTANCTSSLGACCVDQGCADGVSQTDCANSGGTWLGAGTDCSGGDPCNPPGACCIPQTMGCINLNENDCGVAGGVWQGAASDCASTVCYGPCCLPDGACQDDQLESDCVAAGGTFQGDTTCGAVSCPQPQGACCLAAGCLFLTEDDCGIVAGTWQGLGTDCADDDSSGTADDCEPDCPGDIDGDGSVAFADLLAVLSNWGPCPGCDEDLDDDDVVGFADLLVVLSNWGPC